MRFLLLVPALLLVAAYGPCVESSREGVYALTDDAGITRGCFPPLMCPTVAGNDLGGTFRMELVSAGDAVDMYRVREVFWLARLGGEDVPITGHGTYLDGVLEDRMLLRLRVGDAPPELFDSGPVPSAGPGVDEIAITVSINGQTYYDTVIDIRALAFPALPKPTPCGPTGLVCDPDTEVCVAKTPIGPAVVYECQPVPDGCAQDRSCDCAGAALCLDPFDVCRETGENQLLCECPECQ